MSQATKAASSRPKKTLRILVADDDRDTVVTLSTILTDEGHSTYEVYRGDHVLDGVQRFNPDVVLLDIGMPGMSGYDVARELRSIDEDLLLIAVTAWSRTPDKMAAQLAGFNHHLAKPFDPDELLALLFIGPNDRRA
jgi:CheY-like chemotaxis protein